MANSSNSKLQELKRDLVILVSELQTPCTKAATLAAICSRYVAVSVVLALEHLDFERIELDLSGQFVTHLNLDMLRSVFYPRATFELLSSLFTSSFQLFFPP